MLKKNSGNPPFLIKCADTSHLLNRLFTNKYTKFFKMLKS